MKVLFVHDFRAYIHYKNVYTTNLSYDIFKSRYLNVFDEIVICNRCFNVSEELNDKMVLANGDGVNFLGNIPFFKGPDVFLNRKVKKVIKEEVSRNDVVIIRLDSFLGIMAINECKKQNKPYLIELVGCAWDSFWNHGLYGKVLAPFLYMKTKREVWNAKYVIYVTNKFLQGRYPTKGLNTNCSNVNLEKLDVHFLENRINKIKNRCGKKIVIGTVAALNVKYKGQQYIIQALSRLKELGIQNFEYQLIGGGDKAYLESVAKKYNVMDSVKFIGPVEHAKVFRWMDEIDIYAQPSRQEGLPRALIEAMSRALPCLGANTAGIPELIDEKYIFSNSSNNIKEICSILIRMLDKEQCLIQARRNFKEAKVYERELIDRRRKEFLERFRNDSY